jgi:GNAT superfamily N-acetyltransferase
MAVADFYAGHSTLRAVIEAVLEGNLGRVNVDGPARPRVARLDLGCYAIFGGDAGASGATALVASVSPPCELLLPDDQRWRDLALETWGDRLSDRPMRTFSAHALEPGRLSALASREVSDYSIGRIDAEGAGQLDASLEPHAMQVFGDAADFVRRGVGYCARHDGRVVSAATSYAISRGRLEIAVATAPDHRRHGLARIVAARLVLHCLDLGLNPEWSSANPVSKQLALSLGFRPAPLCDVVYLD